MSISTIQPYTFNVPTAAAAIGISRARLYQLIGAGDLEARKVGSKTVVLRSEIERYVAGLPVAAIKPTARRAVR
jgi:excisionase family DNA binding protein